MFNKENTFKKYFFFFLLVFSGTSCQGSVQGNIRKNDHGTRKFAFLHRPMTLRTKLIIGAGGTVLSVTALVIILRYASRKGSLDVSLQKKHGGNDFSPMTPSSEVQESMGLLNNESIGPDTAILSESGKIGEESHGLPESGEGGGDNDELPENDDDDKSNGLPETGNKEDRPWDSDQEKILKKIAEDIRAGIIKNITFFTGAGISTNGGIPDFRSKGGFYEAVMSFYKKNNRKLPKILDESLGGSYQNYFTDKYLKKYPEDFYEIAKTSEKLLAGRPTYTHYFVKLLYKKGILRKYYTQNVDGLEAKIGLPSNVVWQYHGSFNGSHCMKCKKQFTPGEVKALPKKAGVPRCNQSGCSGILKPNVVFFNDSVHDDTNAPNIIKNSDLILVMGTSLTVSPFCSLPHKATAQTPRIFISREISDNVQQKFKRERDLILLRDCDKTLEKLVSFLGWEDDMKAVVGK